MQLLIKELKKHFDLDIWEPKERKGDMTSNAILYAIEFSNFLVGKDYDAIILRGDRYEMLGLGMVSAYKGFKIIHIEGGDESGVIDNKVRHAISHLSDFHFCTNKESHRRLVNMGIPLESIWDFGSLDVEFADKVKPKKLKDKDYILVAYHNIEGEDRKELDNALLDYPKYDKIVVGGNNDYGQEYKAEEFSPEDYINLMRGAKVCIGNSSSLIKEASILKVPVVLVGERQKNRLMPSNIVQVPCETSKIKLAIEFQLQNKVEKDLLYYKKDTSKKITNKLKKIL